MMWWQDRSDRGRANLSATRRFERDPVIRPRPANSIRDRGCGLDQKAGSMAAISSFCPSSTDCLTYRGDHLCCVRFPCAHAVATTPAQRRTVLPCSPTPSYQPSPKGSSGRPVHRPLRGLLTVHSRYGLHTRAATRICGSLYRRLQPLRYLHDGSDYFRLEHFAGWGFHPLESAAFARRTP